jgi:hypothetical protein
LLGTGYYLDLYQSLSATTQHAVSAAEASHVEVVSNVAIKASIAKMEHGRKVWYDITIILYQNFDFGNTDFETMNACFLLFNLLILFVIFPL